jgi:tRNA wybutosine-synthesizing protein 2
MRTRMVAKEDIAKVMDENWVDPQKRPYVNGSDAYLPVKDGFPCDFEIAARRQYHGRGFFILGDVAVLHGRKPSLQEVERIVQFRHPRGVLWIRSLQGHMRRPESEVVYGEVGEVRHVENNFTYLFDPQKVMFAQGNLEEKRRLAGLIRKSGIPERVADMYAGIGYFTIPMAASGASVHAMEINPVAFRYLERNIVVNGLSGRVHATCGDCRHLLYGTYDRILMGHFDAITMLPDALEHVRDGTVLHIHSLGSVECEIDFQLARTGFSAEIHVHKVKKYRPHTWHVVHDVMIL